MPFIDREGIFKAVPKSWRVKTFDSSKATAISIDLIVTAQLVDGEWQDWTQYEEHTVQGDWFVVKKDGTPNLNPIEQLATSLNWQGGLKHVATEDPPRVEVQVTVKSEEYQGKTYFKATWMNPGDYQPKPQGASEDDVAKLDAQFGSLLRAAAKSFTNAKPAKAPPKAKPKADDDNLPF